ncbi:DUF397 domain-containing protein [Streptomyces sp. SBT349]|uniref:DUF397 domain-containing protein n=1 Tax=Streptomyces sp. SBT349 TaxID=1580539 RepID=UPI00066E079D|nr:DUF397 domain-containing protein [Streptomyces sp. SBT349]
MSTIKPSPSQLDLSSVEWHISSHSGGGGNCVRLATLDGLVLIGDSKNPDRPPHVFTQSEIGAFILGVRDGEFDHLLASEMPAD